VRKRALAVPRGLEPPTFGLGNRPQPYPVVTIHNYRAALGWLSPWFYYHCHGMIPSRGNAP
jgi:hypothetical protein